MHKQKGKRNFKKKEKKRINKKKSVLVFRRGSVARYTPLLRIADATSCNKHFV